MRLIDGNPLYEKTAEWEAQALHMVETTIHDEDNAEWKRWSTILTERSAFKHDVADAPTIDAVPVVRCRECFFGRPIKFADGSDMIACDFDRGASRFPEFYCKAGMRKEDEQPEPQEGGAGDG